MHTIYQEQQINIEWSVFRGLSKEKESFVNAKLNVFLTQLGEGDTLADKIHLVDSDVAEGAYHLGYITTNGGDILIELDSNLEPGIYGVKAIWSKNHGRSISYSEKQYLFTITDNPEEALESDKSTVTIKLKSTTATYGLDGMSAYETAVMHDLTTYLTEKEWVQVRASEIETNQIKDGAITTLKIADKAVSTDKIKDLNVTEAKIADGAVTTAKIKDNAVITDKIATGNVTTSKIADKAVTEAKIHDGNVTTPKIADDAVTTNKIGDGQVSELKLAPGAVISSKIADKAVKEQHIDDGAVQERHIDEKAVTTDKIGTGQITTDKIDDYAVKSEHIKPGAVGTMEIANGAVESQHLATEIKDDEGNVVQKAAVQNENIAAGAVTEGTIGTGAVTNDKLGDKAITEAKLKDTSLNAYCREIDEWMANGDMLDAKQSYLEIPIPRQCAKINLTMAKYNSALPTQKKGDTGTDKDDVMKKAMLEYCDKDGNHFTRPIFMSVQGNSTKQYKKKNFAIEMFCEGYTDNSGVWHDYFLSSHIYSDFDDISEDQNIKFTVKFGNWIPQSEFHLKKFYQDVFCGEGIAAYNLVEEIYQAEKCRPSRLIPQKDKKIATKLEGVNDTIVDLQNNALCHPDGFPVEVYVEGVYYGLYVWQLKKFAENYGMDNTDGTTVLLEPEDVTNGNMGVGYNNETEATAASGVKKGFWNCNTAYINWEGFSIKSPKKINGDKELKLRDVNEKKYDGDSPKELYGNHYNTTTGVGGRFQTISNKDCALANSQIVKHMIEQIALTPYEVVTLCGNGSDEEGAKAAKDLFAKRFDVDSMIVYYVLSQILYNFDGYEKNWVWSLVRYGVDTGSAYVKAAVNFYDLDSIFGRWWMGEFVKPNADEGFIGASGDGTKPDFKNLKPTNLLQAFFITEINAFYEKYRRNGILSVDNIVRHLEEWIARCGKDALERNINVCIEKDQYGNIVDALPSYRNSNLNTEWWQQFENTRGTVKVDGVYVETPEWDATKTYNAGDLAWVMMSKQSARNRLIAKGTVNPTDEQITKFRNDYGIRVRCIKDGCTGKNPVLGSVYNNNPYLGGMYDSVERVRNWLTERFKKCDALFSYTENPISETEIRLQNVEDAIGKSLDTQTKQITIVAEAGKAVSGKKNYIKADIKSGSEVTICVTKSSDGMLNANSLNIGFVPVGTDPSTTSVQGGSNCISNANAGTTYKFVAEQDICAVQIRVGEGSNVLEDGYLTATLTMPAAGILADISDLQKQINKVSSDAVREHDGIKYGVDTVYESDYTAEVGKRISSQINPMHVYIAKGTEFEILVSSANAQIAANKIAIYTCKNGDELDYANKKDNGLGSISLNTPISKIAQYDISRLGITVESDNIANGGELHVKIAYYEKGMLQYVEDLQQTINNMRYGYDLNEVIERSVTKGVMISSRTESVAVSIPKGTSFDVKLDATPTDSSVDASQVVSVVHLYYFPEDNGTKVDMGALTINGTKSFVAPANIARLSIGVGAGSYSLNNGTIKATITGRVKGITQVSDQDALSKYSEQIDRAKQFGTIQEQLEDYEITIDEAYKSSNHIPLLTFMHISDTHENSADNEQMGNAVDVLNELAKNHSSKSDTSKYRPVKFMLHTGDVHGGYPTDDISKYEAAVAKATVPVLQVIGNHDAGTRNAVSTGKQHTSAQVYNGMIAPYITAKWGLISKGNKPVITDKCYYFTDFEAEKIRLIVLYDFDGDTIDNGVLTNSTYHRGRMAYGQEQVRWFCETLLDTPEGYGVIIAGHMPRAHRGKTDNGFNTRPLQGALYSENAMCHFSNGNAYPDFIPAIVQKFIDGGVCDETMSAKMLLGSGVYSGEIALKNSSDQYYNFASKKAGVEFICYCDGHTHADGVNFLLNYPKQLELNIGCDNTHYAHYSDSFNKKGTKTEDLMNVYAIDRNENKVYIQRIGNSTSGMGKDRDHLVIDYRGLSKNPGMIPSTEDNE